MAQEEKARKLEVPFYQVLISYHDTRIDVPPQMNDSISENFLLTITCNRTYGGPHDINPQSIY